MSHGSQFRPPIELDEPTSARRQDDHHIGGDLDPQQNPGSCVEVNGPLDKPCQHQTHTRNKRGIVGAYLQTQLSRVLECVDSYSEQVSEDTDAETESYCSRFGDGFIDSKCADAMTGITTGDSPRHSSYGR